MATPSSLLKNAASIRDQLATYQDSVKAFEFSNSAYTDTALAEYSTYLKTRIDSLSATPSISAASKSLSLTKALDSATKQNISASITRENIQVLSGNATLEDKYNVIASQYVRAASNGDMTLAQSLMSQAYSLSQTIQLQRQQAADAAATLAKAVAAAASSAATATAGQQEHIASGLRFSLQQLNQDIKNAGEKDFNATVKKWVSTNSDVLKELGVVLPKNAQPNYFDLVNGVAGAIYNAHMLAYQAKLPFDPGVAQGYYDSAMSLALGLDKLPTLAGSKTIQDIQQAAANPAQFVYNQATGGFTQSTQSGNKVDVTTGKVVPTYSGSIKATILPVSAVTQLTKLGLNVSSVNKDGSAANGVQVQATTQSPQWLRNVLGPNGATDAYINGQGIQFEADSASGTGKAVYTLVNDGSGLHGLFESSKEGDRLVGGDYGFNPNSKNPSSGHSSTNSFGQTLTSGGPHLSLTSDFIGTSAILAKAQQQQDYVTAQNAIAAKALLANTPPPLPTILPPAAAPPPQQITVAPRTAPVTPATRSVSQAAPVASPAKSPQTPGGINLQGGGGIRLQ